jgi:hypothetical protein
MLVAIVLILTTGGVAILRPISKRAGELLEVMAKEKRQPRQAPPETQRMVELMESLHTRLERLEERQDFTDSLLATGREARTLQRPRAESPKGPSERAPWIQRLVPT